MKKMQLTLVGNYYQDFKSKEKLDAILKKLNLKVKFIYAQTRT